MASRPTTEAGLIAARNLSRSPLDPFVITHRVAMPAISGTTTNSKTEKTSVSHGTVISEIPNNSPAIGANAKIRIMSFKAT